MTREVLVRKQYKDQVWFEVKIIDIEAHYVRQTLYFPERYPRQVRKYYQRTDGQSPSEKHSVR